MVRHVIFCLLMLIGVPMVWAWEGETIRVVFTDPGTIVENGSADLSIHVPGVDSFIRVQDWPVIPVRRIIRRYEANDPAVTVHANAPFPRTIQLDRNLAGNGGIRLLGRDKAEPVYTPLSFTTPFPASPMLFRRFRCIDPVTLQPVVWLVIELFPVQLIAADTIVFNPEITVTIQPDTASKVSSEIPNTDAGNRGPAACYIVPDQFVDTAQPLIQHKTMGGVSASIVPLSQALAMGSGQDDPEKLRTFIRQSYETNTTVFFILAGDADVMPVRYCDQTDDPLGMVRLPTDNYYADLYSADGEIIHWDADQDGRIGEYPDDLDDMDFAPDVIVTRIPASTPEEFAVAIDHIIHYESRVTHTDPWFNTVVFAAVDTFNAEAHGETSGIPEGEQYAEMLAAGIFSGKTIIRLYETDVYPKDAVALPENVPPAVGGGAGYLAFHCHGAPDCFQLAEYQCFDHTHAGEMTNGHNLPVVYGFACSTAAFDNELPDYPYSTGAESMPEHFLLQAQGGAIFYVGSTRVAFASGFGHDQSMTGSGAIEYWFWNARTRAVTSPGQMFAAAQIDSLKHIGIHSVYDYINLMEHNAFGDAAVSLGGWLPGPQVSLFRYWAGTPGPGVSCIDPGEASEMTVELVNEGAPIAQPRFALVSDHPDLTVTGNSISGDPLNRMDFVRITGLTFETTTGMSPSQIVPCHLDIFDDTTLIQRIPMTIYIGNDPHLILDTLTWQYESHKNAHADPGETLYLTVLGINAGCEPLVNPQVTMHSNSPFLTSFSVNDVGETGSVLPGHAYISPWYRLTIEIADECPHGTIIPIHCSVTGEVGGPWVADFDLMVEDFRGPRMWDHGIPAQVVEPGNHLPITVAARDVSGIDQIQAIIRPYPSGESIILEMLPVGSEYYQATFTLPDNPGDFSIDIVARDQRGNTQTDAFCLALSSRSLDGVSILVVSFDGTGIGGEAVAEAIDHLGDSAGHWDIRFRGHPTVADIEKLKPDSLFLLYGTGGDVSGEDRNMICSLIESGAGIVLSGWDVLRNTKRNGGEVWLKDVFGVHVNRNSTEGYAMEGIEGEIFYDGVQIRLKKKTGDTYFTADEIEPVNSARGALVFTDVESPGSGAVYRRDTGLRTLAFPFALEHAKTDADLLALLEPIRTFLADHPAEPALQLALNAGFYEPGDPFLLTVRLVNPYGETLAGTLFLALEVGGLYWFWPSWTQYPGGMDSQVVQVPMFDVWAESILDFSWPEVAGPGPVICFFAAAVDSEGQLLDDLQHAEFSY
ncbi:hypothetical protein JXA80_04490 [bacterium]|nr:hypothetical protein [candidate division CSSED10-310 bacterium]